VPLDERRIFLLGVEGTKYGPYTRSEVEGFIAERRIRPGSFVWNLEDPGWKQLSELDFDLRPGATSASRAPGDSPREATEKEADQETTEDPGTLLDKELSQEFARQPRRETEKWKFPRGRGNRSYKSLHAWLGMERETLLALAERADENYRVFPIEGRSKKRWIEAPSELLKQTQRRILDRLLAPMALHGAAHGFVPNRSILTHASNHVKKRWVINLDIRSFFPSVDAERVRKVAGELPIMSDDVDLLVKLTTRKNHLPQGAPTSPALGNLVLRALDRKMCDLVRGTGWFYSRYADDLTLSGFRKPRQMFDKAKDLVHAEGFLTSPEKCRIRGRNRRQMVTGIVVNRKLALPREKRRMVRAMTHRLSNGLVEGDEMNHVLGWLNFASYVERCDNALPVQGSAVRPRIGFFKLLLVRRLFGEGLSTSEIAKRSEISPASVSRVLNHYYELLERRLPTAQKDFFHRADLTSMDSLGTSLLHSVGKAGRIGLVPPEVLNKDNLLRLDSAGRTVLGQVLRASDESSLPGHLRSPSLAEEAENMEKIFKLTLGDQAKFAANLARSIFPDEVYSNLIRPDEGSILPVWILGAAHGFEGFPSLLDYIHLQDLMPRWSYSQNQVLTRAALLYLPFLELAGEEDRKHLLLALEENGVTLLHALAMTSSLDQVPEKLLGMEFLLKENGDGDNVFDLATDNSCIEQLPEDLVQEWEKSAG